jgi:uncharacterized protein (DUF1697 family)
MSQFIAFLRAINVGGHMVKMDYLRQQFESLGFTGVETFIASGNVVFEAGPADPTELARLIEVRLRQALGYEVAAFLRTPSELSGIGGCQPFPQAQFAGAVAFNVAFLKQPPDEQLVHKLMERKTEIDDFRVDGREVYWLCRKKQSESTFSNAVLEKTLDMPSTLRGMNTIKKMAEKYYS